jgi:hypothetical protein
MRYSSLWPYLRVPPINNRDRIVKLGFAHTSALKDVDASAGD